MIERAVKSAPRAAVLVTGALGSVGRSVVHVTRKRGVRVLAGVRVRKKKQAAEFLADGVVGIDDENELAGLYDLDAVADTVGGSTVQRLLKHIRAGVGAG